MCLNKNRELKSKMMNLRKRIKRIATKNNRYREKEERHSKIYNRNEVKGCCEDCENLTEHISYKYDDGNFRRCSKSLYLASIRFTV